MHCAGQWWIKYTQSKLIFPRLCSAGHHTIYIGVHVPKSYRRRRRHRRRPGHKEKREKDKISENYSDKSDVENADETSGSILKPLSKYGCHSPQCSVVLWCAPDLVTGDAGWTETGSSCCRLRAVVAALAGKRRRLGRHFIPRITRVCSWVNASQEQATFLTGSWWCV